MLAGASSLFWAVLVVLPALADAQAWINEFHYDNSGADSGEFIEVAATSSTSLTGYKLVLYNGADGTSYSTVSVPAASPTGQGVSLSVVNLSVDGLQNGSPDGIALVDGSNAVIDFISYEGSFKATNGAASGQTSVDVIAQETSTTPLGYSIQRTGSGCTKASFTAWSAPGPQTKGTVNTGQTFSCGAPVPVPVPVAPVPVPVPVAPVPVPVPVAPVPVPVPVPVVAPTVPLGSILNAAMSSSATGSGSSSKSVTLSSEVFLGYLPAGLRDIYIRLDSTANIDLRLYDGGTRIVHRSGGLFSGSIPGAVAYSGVTVQYSGYNGEQLSTSYGKEYLFIAGTLPRPFVVSVYGFQAGTADIKYRWGYYNGAYGLSGSSLKAALHTAIDKHTGISYTTCWTALQRTDQDVNNVNNVRGTYSAQSISKANQDTGCSCDNYWNREHTFPQSLGSFSTSIGPGTDLHHVRAVDKSLNTERSNKVFADGGSSLSTSATDCPTCLETTNTFMPATTDKGSVARMLFYMATRYNGDANAYGYALNLVNGTGSATDSKTIGDLVTLKNWHLNFPVSAYEYQRNNLIMDIQGNRNPFIDHPEWAQLIW